MKISMKGKKRLAVSPVIATLLLIAIAVAAAIIVYAFVTGLIGGLTGGGGSNLITVSGNLIVPTGTTTGNLVLNLKNSAANPIVSVLAVFPTSMTGPGALNSCYGPIPPCNAGAVNFAFNSLPITVANPLPVGSETSATSAVTQTAASALQSGNSYSFTITVTFATGSPQTQLVSITAQL
jgi:hypothetical protein